jgi:hypothetical protein
MVVRGGRDSNKVGEVEVSSAPLLRAGMVAALSQVPGADGNSDCPSPTPLPSPASWASLARDAMARLTLSLLPSLLVGAQK